jgi:hypothetical protein
MPPSASCRQGGIRVCPEQDRSPRVLLAPVSSSPCTDGSRRAAPLHARPRSSERALHQSKLEPTSCSTRFVVALRPFHTPPASTGCWRHPSALTSSARGMGLAGRGLERPVTLETALPLWAAGTYDFLLASRYAFLNPLWSRETQMEKAWRPDNDLVRAVDNHRWTTGTQSASLHGMCSPAGMCPAEPHDDHCFRWSAWVWSPPPESNRRPHPYHGTTRNRCAEPRFPRSRPTVGAKVIGSLSAELCAHSRAAAECR